MERRVTEDPGGRGGGRMWASARWAGGKRQRRGNRPTPGASPMQANSSPPHPTRARTAQCPLSLPLSPTTSSTTFPPHLHPHLPRHLHAPILTLFTLAGRVGGVATGAIACTLLAGALHQHRKGGARARSQAGHARSHAHTHARTPASMRARAHTRTGRREERARAHAPRHRN